MAQRLPQLIAALCCAGAACLAHAAEAPRWEQLSVAERTALAPIAYDWNDLPAAQRLKLLGVAKEFSRLTPKQQEVFYSRLRPWTLLSREQRELARRNYHKLRELPPREQEEVKRLWMETGDDGQRRR